MPLSTNPLATQAAKVEVDTESGLIEVLRLINAAERGREINPGNAREQVIGGAIMGPGQAAPVEIDFGEDSTPELRGLRDYDVMHATDPLDVEDELVETYEPTGAFGPKTDDQMTILGSPATVANAVQNAVGVRMADLAITAEKVWDAHDGKEGIYMSVRHKFDFACPDSVEEAIGLLKRADDAQVFAGGYSLVPQLKDGDKSPDLLVDISNIEDLDGITHESQSAVRIGALVMHDRIADSPPVRKHAAALAEATDSVGDFQAKHQGTIGGTSHSPTPSTTRRRRFWPST